MYLLAVQTNSNRWRYTVAIGSLSGCLVSDAWSSSDCMYRCIPLTLGIHAEREQSTAHLFNKKNSFPFTIGSNQQYTDKHKHLHKSPDCLLPGYFND